MEIFAARKIPAAPRQPTSRIRIWGHSRSKPPDTQVKASGYPRKAARSMGNDHRFPRQATDIPATHGNCCQIRWVQCITFSVTPHTYDVLNKGFVLIDTQSYEEGEEGLKEEGNE